MTFQRQTIIPASCVLLSAACAIPEQNNPHDPVNVPEVRVAMIDHTQPDGTCSTDFDIAWPEVVAISRGRCLAIDARNTTDPQSRPTLEDPLEGIRFAFSVATGGDATRTLQEDDTTGVFAIPRAAQVSLPPNRQLEFLVTASADGARAEGAASLVLLNSRPIAVPDAPRRLAAGGYPWTSDGYEIAFRGERSHDPDSDELLYCWNFPGESAPVCSDEPTDPAFTRTIPLTRGRYAAKLTVHDDLLGSRESPDAWAEVFVGSPSVWVVSEGPRRVQRLDEQDGASILFDFQLYFATRISLPGNDGIAFRDESGLTLAPLPTGSPLPPPLSLAPGTYPTAIVGDGLGSIWTLTREDGDPYPAWTVRRHPYEPTQPAGLGAPIFETAVGSPDDFCAIGIEPQLSVDAMGRAWVASGVWSDLRFFTPSGDRILVDEAVGGPVPEGQCYFGESDDRGYTSIAARPVSGETWVSLVPAVPTADDPVRLLVYSSGATAAPEISIPLDFPLTALAFASADELWVATPFDGLILVDARSLREGAPFALSTIATFLDVRDVVGLHVDPVTGGLLVLSEPMRVHVLDGDRSLRSFDTDFYPRTIDGTGAIWIDNQGLLLRAVETTQFDRVVLDTSVPRPALGAMAVDPATGWLWQALTLGPDLGTPPWAIGALAPDGSLARLITTLDLGSGPAAVPPIRSFRLTPDGKTMWLRVGGPTPAVHRLDLTTDPPLALASTTNQTVVDLFSSDRYAPSAPDGAFAWVYHSASHSFLTVDAAFTPSLPVLTLEGAEATGNIEDVRAALLPASNRLCILNDSGLNGTVRMRYLSATGDGSVPVFSSGFLGYGDVAVSTWVDGAGNEGCWGFFVEDDDGQATLAVSHDGNGNSLGSHPIALSLTPSVLALDGDIAWLVYTDFQPTGGYGRTRVDLNGTDLSRPGLEGRIRAPFSAQ